MCSVPEIWRARTTLTRRTLLDIRRDGPYVHPSSDTREDAKFYMTGSHNFCIGTERREKETEKERERCTHTIYHNAPHTHPQVCTPYIPPLSLLLPTTAAQYNTAPRTTDCDLESVSLMEKSQCSDMCLSGNRP